MDGKNDTASSRQPRMKLIKRNWLRIRHLLVECKSEIGFGVSVSRGIALCCIQVLLYIILVDRFQIESSLKYLARTAFFLTIVSRRFSLAFAVGLGLIAAVIHFYEIDSGLYKFQIADEILLLQGLTLLAAIDESRKVISRLRNFRVGLVQLFILTSVTAILMSLLQSTRPTIQVDSSQAISLLLLASTVYLVIHHHVKMFQESMSRPKEEFAKSKT